MLSIWMRSVASSDVREGGTSPTVWIRLRVVSTASIISGPSLHIDRYGPLRRSYLTNAVTTPYWCPCRQRPVRAARGGPTRLRGEPPHRRQQDASSLAFHRRLRREAAASGPWLRSG